jgi:hypothetical protein
LIHPESTPWRLVRSALPAAKRSGRSGFLDHAGGFLDIAPAATGTSERVGRTDELFAGADGDAMGIVWMMDRMARRAAEPLSRVRRSL